MTQSLGHKALVHFGKLVVEEVRDWAIGDWDKKIDGRMKGGPEEEKWRARMKALGPDAEQLLKELLPEIVDATLHFMMFLLERGGVMGLKLSVTTEDGETFPDINEVSDGLAGDLVMWIPAFSKQRHKPLPPILAAELSRFVEK